MARGYVAPLMVALALVTQSEAVFAGCGTAAEKNACAATENAVPAAPLGAKCSAVSVYETCMQPAASCADAVALATIAKDKTDFLTASCVACAAYPLCQATTTTVTPWDSSASSGDSGSENSLRSSYSNSLWKGSSGSDQSNSAKSSGSKASGSSGSFLELWQWLLLLGCCCCCCIAAGVTGFLARTKKKTKPRPTPPAPRPVPTPAPEPVAEVMPLLTEPELPSMTPLFTEPMMPLVPTTTASMIIPSNQMAFPQYQQFATPTTSYAAPATYAAPMTSYAAPAAYAAPMTSYAAPAAYAASSYAAPATYAAPMATSYAGLAPGTTSYAAGPALAPTASMPLGYGSYAAGSAI